MIDSIFYCILSSPSVAFITFVSLSSIILSLLAIAYRESTVAIFKLLTQNAASSLFFASLLWTGFFVLDAMRPGKIARVSQAIKIQVEEESTTTTHQPGNLAQFLLDFNAIEQMLDNFAQEYLNRPTIVSSVSNVNKANNRSGRPNWPKTKVVLAMATQGVISKKLAEIIVDLIRYRNALVHGQNMTVDSEVVQRMKTVREELQEIIAGRDSGQPEGSDLAANI